MTPAKPQDALADQTHWYDGWWYRRVIDPMSGGGLARAVADFLDPGTTVLDIACGTGALACYLASHCREVVGIDLSSKMIAFARQQATKQGLRNLDFQHAGALGLSKRFLEFSNISFERRNFGSLGFARGFQLFHLRHRLIVFGPCDI